MAEAAKRCANDRPVIAVMFAVHSQEGLREGFKLKTRLHHRDKWLFP